MSGIRDYLNMVVNGIKNGDKIIEALMIASQAKNGTIEPDALAEILMRKDLCVTCPFNSDNAKKLNNYSSALPFTHCTLCTCRIGGEDTKEYCLSCNCGMEAWNQRNPHLPPMQLKWKAFQQEQK